MLNIYGTHWVNKTIAKIDEDQVYASIGAYDEEAFKGYLILERVRLEEIALRHQDDPEFQINNRPQ